MTNVDASGTRPKFQCAECELVNDCDCLSRLRLLDLIAPILRTVLEHIATDGSFLDKGICERLALLLDRHDQIEREIEAMPAWGGDPGDGGADRNLIDDLIGPWGYEQSYLRTPEGIGALRKVPAQHVRALLEKFLRDSRPEPACSPEPIPAPVTWSAWARAVDMAVERRAP
jgi:hypothetical protein